MRVLNRYEELPITTLMVNPANDRHGEMADELEAMNWLLSDSQARMRTLAKDIAEKGYVFAAPLVSKVDDVWLLHDGNRRVTCVKMLFNPMLANDPTWQRFFDKLSKQHAGNIPSALMCRIEEDETVIDEIVYRLHAGGESGVGTVDWNLRQKQNHAIRTGNQTLPSLGMQIESYMKDRKLISEQQSLPVRNIERLLSSDKYLRKVGLSYKKGQLISFIYPEHEATKILRKVCNDLMSKQVTIDGLIKNTQKDDYFTKLEVQGYSLEKQKPSAAKTVEVPISKPSAKSTTYVRPRYSLIPADASFVFDDSDELHRIKKIIEELQTLPLKKYINAASVLFRLLIEASTNYYNAVHGQGARSDKIHVTVKAALDHMVAQGTIFGKDAETLSKFSQQEEIISAHTFHGYVHSHMTVPSEQHLCAMWESFAQYVRNCVSAKHYMQQIIAA